MSLSLVPEPISAGDRLARLLTDNHADGKSKNGAACSRRAEPGLVPHADGVWWCDPSWDRHGLSWWYRHVLGLVRSTSSNGRRGAGGSISVPIDISALDFLAHEYSTLDDPDTFLPGFVPTIFGLEQSARRALRYEPRHRPRAEGFDGLPSSYDARVPAALSWIADRADDLTVAAPMFADTVRDEALRLLGRARAMVLGKQFSVTVCMYCTRDTVVGDHDRAACINPQCRKSDGTLYCWRYVVVDEELGTQAWVEIDEPFDRGRGRNHVTEDDLTRWATG